MTVKNTFGKYSTALFKAGSALNRYFNFSNALASICECDKSFNVCLLIYRKHMIRDLKYEIFCMNTDLKDVCERDKNAI